MFWMVLYLMVGIIFSVFYTKIICKITDTAELCKGSRIMFVVYFAVANIVAWPIFTAMSIAETMHLNE